MRPESPVFGFIAPWSLVLVGQLFPLCHLISPHVSIFHLIVLGNMVSIIIFYCFGKYCFPKSFRDPDDPDVSERLKNIFYGVFYAYLVVQVFQVLYRGGFPLLWLMTGDKRHYFDYGITSLNGLLNTMYIFSATGITLLYLKERKRKQKILLLLVSIIPIMIISRGIMIMYFVQMSCVALFYYPKIARRLFQLGVGLLITFIVVGNYRTGLTQLTVILEPCDFFPKILYPLLWIYAYVVTPFNNINCSIDQIVPLGFPYFETVGLIPRFLRQLFISNDVSTGFKLVHRSMTVSTFYLNPLQDFGPFYAFSFMATFQFFVVRAFYRAKSTKMPEHVLEYAVLYSIMVLSIFSNLLVTLPVIFQIFIIKIFKLRVQRRFGRTAFIASSSI